MKTSPAGPRAVIPSFVAKVARAKKHLVELEDEIASFVDLRPYTVSQRIKDNGKLEHWRLEFTADPANTDMPIVAADAIYNLRSALDHLMASLVPRVRRTSVMFPVMWEGVWEVGTSFENEQRVKDRGRWQSLVRDLPDAAVAILKSLQPPDPSTQPTHVNRLALVNALSNRDRHEKLPTVALGLRQLWAEWTNPDGTLMQGTGQIAPTKMFENQAEILAIPKAAVDVEIQGVPVVALKTGQQDGYVEIPEQLGAALRLIEERVIPSLMPYVRP